MSSAGALIRTRARATALGAGLVAVAIVAACTQHAPPPAQTAAKFTVGAPYQAGGEWWYPRVDFSLDTTGLASVAREHGPSTSDGERYDPTAMAAGHHTLQLPAIARVTNLDTGLSALVRINDRGPAAAGRVIELTPRAAELLQIADGSRVRLEMQEGESRQLAAETEGGNVPIDVATAPSASVVAENLAPPPGVGTSARGRSAPGSQAPRAVAIGTTSAIPQRLPEQVSRGPASGGLLYVVAGSFSSPRYARILQARLAGLGAQVATDYSAPRDRAIIVRIGPFQTATEADAALGRALRAGVTDASIIVGS
jgi:rare lipoprotein A